MEAYDTEFRGGVALASEVGQCRTRELVINLKCHPSVGGDGTPWQQ